MISPHVSLLFSAALTWTMLVVAALARTRFFFSLDGVKAAFGNRDDLEKPAPFADRADRAAKNMVENLPLFAAVLLAAWMANVPARDLETPCAIFLGARIVYAPLYWGGVKYVRTAVWFTSLIGLLWIGALAAHG